jgi:O-succinylhomoserine sulfhydrylase
MTSKKKRGETTRDSGLHPESLLVRGGLTRSGFQETAEALYLTSGYVYESAEQAADAFQDKAEVFMYSRYANPTVSVFEERLALLEGAEACRATASGMAAVFSALACQLKAGDRLVASRALFGSCHVIVSQILPRFGVESVFVDGHDLAQWKEALSVPAAAVFLESPSNPMLDLVDLEAVCALAKKAGARVVVDNVFATPLYQRPFEFGADVVVYSATKHIDGQGRCLGGAVLASEAFIKDLYTPFYRHTGPSMSPFNAWVMAKALETLPLRVERQCASALSLAERLSVQQKLSLVRYPGLTSHPQHALAVKQMSGFGSLVTFEVKGGRAEAFKVMNALELIDISNNLGDSKTLITHPASTTHQRLTPEERKHLGISEGTLRLSVGLEHPDDLLADIDRALSAV